MDYYGLLFLYYLKGLSGKSVLRLFFNIEAGGTEQLLPENTSTPTTTPILADIQYPDELRTDQYFTYRETPTTVSNKARIKTIKGNTLKWNQLVQNGNFADSSVWQNYGSTFTVSNGVATIKSTNASNQFGIYQPITKKTNHKYFISFEVKKYGTIQLSRNYYAGGEAGQDRINDGVFQKIDVAPTNSTFASPYQICFANPVTDIDNDYFTLKNYIIIDLTEMFGAGKEPTTVEEFTSLFPLPYYDHNAGTLLSFNGTGLKTGGENLIDFSTLQIGKNWFKSSAVDRAIIEFAVEENKEYTISFDYSLNVSTALIVFRTGWNTGQISNISAGSAKEYTFTTPSNCKVVCVQFNARVSSFVLAQSDFYGFWNCALTDTFSTNTLPISTYFPTGMKSAGTAYDELTPSKAITRVGNVTFDGTQTVAGSNFSSTQCRMFIEAPNVKPFNPSTSDEVDNGIISSYLQSASNDATFGGAKGIHRRINGASQICVSLGTDGYASGITTETLFNQYLASHPLTVYYELAEYQETPITTEDANEALSLLMGKSVSSSNAKEMIGIITKGE